MRNVVQLIVVISLLAGCGGQQSAEDFHDSEIIIDSGRLVTTRYRVEGMTCIGCENTVNYAVEEIPGVVGCESSVQESCIVITYDTGMVDTGIIAKAINGKGYHFKGEWSGE